MMGDPLKPVAPGQPLEIHAKTWNEFLYAAREARKRRGTGIDPDGSRFRFEPVRVQNVSSIDRDRGDALAIQGPVFGPDDSPDEYAWNLSLEVDTPTASDAGQFVVLLEPIPAGDFGRAVVSGLAQVNVDFGSDGTGLDFADVKAGAVELLAGTSGAARILWVNGSRSGIVECVVRIGNDTPAAAMQSNVVAGGRLAGRDLASGAPFADMLVSSDEIFYVPADGANAPGKLSLWNGAAWDDVPIPDSRNGDTPCSLVFSSRDAGLYDVFGYDDGAGVLTLEGVAFHDEHNRLIELDRSIDSKPLKGGGNEIQTVTITGTPTGGTFTLSFDGAGPTAAIDFDATAAEVQTALEGLPNINVGDVVCNDTGSLPDDPVTVMFRGQYAGQDVAVMTADGSGLTGGTTPDADAATTTGATAAELTKRYLGTVRLYDTDAFIDGGNSRAIYNAYNKLQRDIFVAAIQAGGWNPSTTLGEHNGGAAGDAERFVWVDGLGDVGGSISLSVWVETDGTALPLVGLAYDPLSLDNPMGLDSGDSGARHNLVTSTKIVPIVGLNRIYFNDQESAGAGVATVGNEGPAGADSFCLSGTVFM